MLTLAYPVFGTPARWYDRDDAHEWAQEDLPQSTLTNDGLEWLDRVPLYYQEGGVHELKYTRDAITWARENIDGSPTTIEAVGPLYRSLGSRFAINTGLPTVAAWDFHQRQQRGKFDYLVSERQNDVRSFYETTDVSEAQRIIDKYGVEWVIVGDEEAFNYPAEGLEKFTGGLNGTLELAYENPAIRIFHVIPEEELAGASATAP